MNITFNPQIHSNNRTFGAKYTPSEICADLCKGACCNHGAPMSATLKRIADKFNASYYQLPDSLKPKAIIKSPIIKWVVDSNDIEVNRVNDLANVIIDAISREKDPRNISALEESLEALNKKLESMLVDNEKFLLITNPDLSKNPKAAMFSNVINPCAFKDGAKTNKCSIYGGIKVDENKIVDRPEPCHIFGSDEFPCPWHRPEKLDEIVEKTRQKLALMGYKKVPKSALDNYVKEQFNLNETWFEKIYKPFLDKK